jgi:hypothetical protein
MVSLMMWSTGQNDVIRELGHKGVQAVHDEILGRYGVEHTLHAIEAQACRIHASLKVLTECPECHALGVRLNRQTGLCPLCTERQHVAEEQAFNEILEAERDKAENSPEIEELRRKYAALRQRNARLRKRYGLPGKKERSE